MVCVGPRQRGATSWTRSVLVGVCALLFAIFLSRSAHADAFRVASFPIANLKPTQMEVGVAAADAKLEEWRSKARESGMSLRSYAERVLAPKMADKEIEGILDPSGAIRITDGHHRVLALRKVERETGVTFRIKVALVADYTGMSTKEYARHFLGVLKKGHFTPEAQRLPPEDRIRRLPSDFDGLTDNPIRSAVDAAMVSAGLNTSDMADYVQFHASEVLVARGLLRVLEARGLASPTSGLAPSRALDPRVVGVVGERLLADPEVKDFLRSCARPGREAAVEGALARAEVKIAVADLGPTQEVDVAEAREKVAAIRTRAAKKDMTLREYVTKVVAPSVAAKPVEVVVDPRGKVLALEKHQRIAALAQVAKEAGVPLHVTAEVVENFHGQDDRTYLTAMAKLLERGRGAPRVAAHLSALPPSFDGLAATAPPRPVPPPKPAARPR